MEAQRSRSPVPGVALGLGRVLALDDVIGNERGVVADEHAGSKGDADGKLVKFAQPTGTPCISDS